MLELGIFAAAAPYVSRIRRRPRARIPFRSLPASRRPAPGCCRAAHVRRVTYGPLSRPRAFLRPRRPSIRPRPSAASPKLREVRGKIAASLQLTDDSSRILTSPADARHVERRSFELRSTASRLFAVRTAARVGVRAHPPALHVAGPRAETQCFRMWRTRCSRDFAAFALGVEIHEKR